MASLLCLPAELRVIMFEKCLVQEHEINILHLRRYRQYVAGRSQDGTALFLINRQIRDESLDVFFGQNTFYINMGQQWKHNPNKRLWTDQILYIQRLHIFIRPYSYLQWHYASSHSLAVVKERMYILQALPPRLKPKLTIITVASPSVVSPEESSRWVLWDQVIRRYSIAAVSRWIRHAHNDMMRVLESALDYARATSSVVVLVGENSKCLPGLVRDDLRLHLHDHVPHRFMTGNLLLLANAGHARDNILDAQVAYLTARLVPISSQCRENDVALMGERQENLLKMALTLEGKL